MTQCLSTPSLNKPNPWEGNEKMDHAFTVQVTPIFLNGTSSKILSFPILFLPPMSKKTVQNQDGARQISMITTAAKLFMLVQHNGALDYKSNTALLR